MFKPSVAPPGYIFESDPFTMFFAQRHCAEAALAKRFANFEFIKMKQVHGDRLIEAKSSLAEADAQWTEKLNCALLVSTADCLPVLVAHPRFVCAIHAGWRGVKNEIVLKSLTALSLKFSGLAAAVVAIGPFIHAENFEVDRELGREFLELYDGYFRRDSNLEREAVVLPHENPEQKVYVDLYAVVRAQLQLAGVAPTNIHNLGVNTYTSNDLASYRRDKTGGRNLSFVARRK